MGLWNIKEIKSALQNNFIKVGNNYNIEEVLIDSRKKTNNGLFIAIKGKNNDGHNFLKQAFNNGATAAIVENKSEFKNDPRLILVKNSFEALKQLGIYSSSRFKGKKIAITGSVGKTSIKEMLKAVFSTQGKTFATIGNLNNHFGLPLSLSNLPEDYDYGIFEMGMNHLGEITPLSKMTKPDIAIISNVVSAHIGNFNNEKEIALAKSEIFSGVTENGFAIINNDNKYHDYLRSRAIINGINSKNIINFGYKKGSNIQLNSSQSRNNFTSEVNVTINLQNVVNKKVIYSVNSINQTIVNNSLISIAALQIIGKNFNSGLKALNELQTPKGRGNIIKINHNGINITIIDDSYNANSTSMIAGLNFLSDLKDKNTNSRTIAIIGDMLELGKEAVSEHEKLAEYINKNNIDQVFLVGELMQNLIKKLKKEKIAGNFKNSEDLAKELPSFIKQNDILLIKGSRGMAMERSINKL